MRKFFIFFYHPCYFQAGKVLSCQLWGHARASTHAIAACMGAEKALSWYLSICTILESYICWRQRKVLRTVSPPPSPRKHLPPEELGPPLSNCTPRPENGWRHTYKNAALNTSSWNYWDDLQHLGGQIFKWQQKKNWWYKLVILNTFTLWVSPVFFPPLWSTHPGPLPIWQAGCRKLLRCWRARVVCWYLTNGKDRPPNSVTGTFILLLHPQRFIFIPLMLPAVCFSFIIPSLVTSQTHTSFKHVHFNQRVGPLKV